MNLAEIFNFESPKQRKKRQREYFKKVFKFGEEQKEWEKNIIEKIFSQKKEINNYIFEVLVLKEKLYNAEHPDEDDEVIEREEVLKDWEKNRVNTNFSKEDCAILKVIAVLENDCNAFENLPSKEEIILLSKSYL